MPCIQIKTNLEIKAPQEQEIKSQLGHAISLIPGKSEQWLMITLEPGRDRKSTRLNSSHVL